MLSLEHRARSFFFQCRISRGYKSGKPSSNRTALGEQRRLFTSSSPCQHAEKKPYYVTSPIFYVNAAPHAGHLYTLVLTDVLKRWNRLVGDDRATLLTGTDEHGMKIQRAAQKAAVDVKLFCDQHAAQFKSLCRAANISYDRFIRTTDQDHKAAVEHFWTELNHNGYIYEAKHEGWYSVSDETFYPESQVSHVLDPSTGNTKYVSKETGKEVEWTSETNYHFRLSAFRDKLLEYYRSNPGTIVPQQRMNFILGEIETGLKDLSISRPSSRLSWGVRVPGDNSQTIYVWLDALINYLTMAGYPLKSPSDPDYLWPPNCQVIGKDIIRFHTIYWPAFLMALNLPIAQRFLSHAHWTMNSEKMSKSAGNGVNPFFAIDRFGVDCIRFYMAHEGGIVDDADYENSFIAQTYNDILRGKYGNVMYRVFRSRSFNTREAVKAARDHDELNQLILHPNQEVGPDVPRLFDDIRSQHTSLMRLADEVKACMEIPNPRNAVQAISEMIRQTNKYFHKAALWQDEAFQSPNEMLVRQYGLFISAESLRIISILLQPFMPEKASEALNMMQVQDSRRTFTDARIAADFDYGTTSTVADTERAAALLFPRLMSAN